MRSVLHKNRYCRGISALAVLVMFAAAAASADGDTSLNVEARPNGAEVFLNPGTITVSYTLPVIFAGASNDGGGPGGGGPGALTNHGLVITVKAGNQQLVDYEVSNPSISQSGTVLNTGSFSFYNPAAQLVDISGSGTYVRNVPGRFPGLYPVFQEWTVLNGKTTVVGGDILPPSGSTISPQGPGGRSNTGQAPGVAPANIHAVIISGLSDPAKVISSPNVTLTGGIVALGKDGSPPATPSSWSPGLRIVPDYALLTGEKIPPVTPNILDVRIVRQEVTADFPPQNPQPSN